MITIFDHTHYVPVLLARRGERRALSDLAPAVRPSITPLFVVPPVDWNYDTSSPAKSTDAHIRGTGPDLAKCWSGRAFIDPFFLDDGERMASGDHPLEFMVEEANQAGGMLVPCVSTLRDAAYRKAVASIHARDGRGACIRLSTAEWPSAVGSATITDLLNDINLWPRDVDLVLDVADEVAAASHLSATAVRAELAALPHLTDWRTVTVVAGGYPAPGVTLSQGISVLNREDWAMYSRVVAAPVPSRLPTFGDYAIAHPDPNASSVDPKFMQISSVFRYTVDNSWLVAKGQLFKGRGGNGLGGAAMLPVAGALVADVRFAGASHCAGDQWLADQAAPAATGGNPEAWRRHATVHHLTQLTTEIANLHGPSVGSAPSPATP